MSPETLTVEEGVGSAKLTVNLSAVWGADVTVTVTAEGIEATVDEDYTDPATPVTIAAGQTSAQVSVPVIDDEDDESDETFRVSISNPDWWGDHPEHIEPERRDYYRQRRTGERAAADRRRDFPIYR